MVSPGFTPRPWLSGSAHHRADRRLLGVTGVYAPALVERGPKGHFKSGPDARVAGVYAPALVERGWCLMPWAPTIRCRRGLRPGLG